MSEAGISDRAQARRLGCDRQRVRRWRRRWCSIGGKIAALEANGVGGKEFENAIVEALEDNERSGAPPTFTAEQVARIIAVACERPGDGDVPLSHWSASDLAKRWLSAKSSPRSLHARWAAS